MARFMALMEGRGYVTPDDVRNIALPVMIHRLVVKPDAMYRGVSEKDVIRQLIETVPVARRL
jgi:MoxR-like ATPase